MTGNKPDGYLNIDITNDLILKIHEQTKVKTNLDEYKKREKKLGVETIHRYSISETKNK